MTMRRVDLGITHVAPVVQQRLDDLAAALGRKAPVGGKAHQQKFAGGACQRVAQVAAVGTSRVKIVQRTRDQQVGVGVKVLGKLVALVTQVALDLEFSLQRAEEVI